MTAFVALPLRSDAAAFSFRTTLASEEFVFAFRYNQREGAWYLSLYDTDVEPIVLGVKVVVGIPLFRGCVDARKPKGTLVAIDSTQQDLDPGLTDLGNRVTLVFGEYA